MSRWASCIGAESRVWVVRVIELEKPGSGLDLLHSWVQIVCLRDPGTAWPVLARGSLIIYED